MADGGVDRGGAVGAVQACEPVAGSRCVALRLVEGASGIHPPGCGASRVCFGVRVLRSGHLEAVADYGVAGGRGSVEARVLLTGS